MKELYYQKLNSAFLAHFARRLSDLITEQGSEILIELGLKTPASSVSTMLYLANNESVTVANLAVALGVSHQMATQRTNSLEKLGLIKRTPQLKDKRSKVVELTKSGRREVTKLHPFTDKVSGAFKQLEDEIGCELASYIRRAENQLLNKPLRERI